MTRLHEALERAKVLAGGTPEEASASTTDDLSVPKVPRAWQFDAELPWSETEQSAAAEPAPPDRIEREPLDNLEPKASYGFATERNSDRLIVGPNTTSVFVEQYRRLAAALHHAQVQSGARTVMVGSALESEGKTLTAANLALTFSHSYQRKVLLIDADLRRPSQHVVFQLSSRIGIGDILRSLEPAPSMRLPVQRVSSHLWVMPAGRPDPDPMSGLVSETMRQLLREATEQFDWVMVDTPPVALMTDANLLAAMIDLALLVVNANSTPYPIVRKAIEAIGSERVLGIVLNRADERETAPGYYGYAYAYGYGSRRRRRRWLPFRGRRDRDA